MNKILWWCPTPWENDGGAIVTYYQMKEMNQQRPEITNHLIPKVWSQVDQTELPYCKFHKVTTKYFGQVPNEIPKIMDREQIKLLVLFHIPWEYFPIIDKVHKIGGKVINWQTIHWVNDVLFLSDKLQDFDWWIPPTQYAMETLVGVGRLSRGRMTVIPHGVDTTCFFPHNTNELRNSLGIKPDQKMILFVGRCQLTKGIVPTMLTARKLCNEFDCHVIFKAGVHDGVTKAREMAHLLYKMTKWDSRIHFLTDWTTPSFMEELTAASDILVCPSGHEGFSLPPLEAMACFPYNTKVFSPFKITKTFKRYYNGKMIEIKTNGRKLLCTPEHPILTINGWMKAKDLYIGTVLLSIEESNGEMETRRIGDIIEELQNQTNKRSDIVTSKQNKMGYQQKSTRIRSWQNWKRCISSLSNSFINRTINIFGWNNRWRRNINILQKKKRKINSSSNPNFKFQSEIDRLAQESIFNYSAFDRNTQKSTTTIFICDTRKKDIRTTSEITTLSNNQRQTLQNINRFYSESFGKGLRRKIFRNRMGNVSSNSGIKREKVTSLKIKSFSGHVYNLQTENELYIANGVIVHNCNKPVAITDIPVHRELLGGKNGVCGLLMPPSMPTEYVNDTQMVTVPSYDMIYGSVKYLLENPDEAKVMGEKGLKRATEYYDLRNVCKQWFDLLGKLEK